MLHWATSCHRQFTYRFGRATLLSGFEKLAIPGLFYLIFWSLEFCTWLDSNCRPLASVASTLETSVTRLGYLKALMTNYYTVVSQIFGNSFVYFNVTFKVKTAVTIVWSNVYSIIFSQCCQLSHNHCRRPLLVSWNFDSSKESDQKLPILYQIWDRVLTK